MILHGDRVVLRPVEAGDLAPFTAMFEAPGMDEWWPGEDRAKLARELVEPDDELTVWTLLVDGEVVGAIQSSEETDPDYRHAGIDIALHPDWHGQGVGTDAVRTLARHLLEHGGHHRLVIDPSAANARAIRCYEKVGFRPVGIMRQYERGRDGTFHDGLLMDL
ncbi:MAG: aminoglycoside 6-N-acetyltransferase, partial [Acidimicrobiales bacterium]|nr:aminoglycoside 6-N-acetyltransferase [Acidimicrobiales bacterium]